jgi:addiction module HigA family antidote
MLPKNRRPTHPGIILRKHFLLPLKITQSKLASHVGWSQPKVNEIVTGKRGVSAEAAIVLGKALGTSAEFWLNLQKNVELWDAMQTPVNVRKIA